MWPYQELVSSEAVQILNSPQMVQVLCQSRPSTLKSIPLCQPRGGEGSEEGSFFASSEALVLQGVFPDPSEACSGGSFSATSLGSAVILTPVCAEPWEVSNTATPQLDVLCGITGFSLKLPPPFEPQKSPDLLLPPAKKERNLHSNSSFPDRKGILENLPTETPSNLDFVFCFWGFEQAALNERPEK